MSSNNQHDSNSYTFDRIKSVLSESLWLKQNENEVLKGLAEISKKALGIAKCSKFRVTEDDFNYGVFESAGIELQGFCSKDANEFCWPIDELYWTVKLHGLGKTLDKRHPITTPFGCDMSNDDTLCGIGLTLNPRTHSLATKIYYFDYKFTIIPI